MKNKESTLLLLEARALNYKFFNIAFASEITPENLPVLCDKSIIDCLSAFTPIESLSRTSYIQAVDDLITRLSSVATYDEGQLQALCDEYTALFIGPIALEVAPYESSYTGDSRLLFQQSTIDVRNVYRKNGFLPAEYPRVVDDHIALEFAFMAELAKRASKAYEQGAKEACEAALRSSLDFIDDHLRIWLPQFLEKMRTSQHADFYLTLAQCALEYVAIDKAFATEVREWQKAEVNE